MAFSSPRGARRSSGTLGRKSAARQLVVLSAAADARGEEEGGMGGATDRRAWCDVRSASVRADRALLLV
eukprot:4043957-Alexandrium_andersonii.AAC.1